MKKISNKQEEVKKYILGYPNFKYITEAVNGFNVGELITIAARPGCGKSTFCKNLIYNFNFQNIKTLLISTEETEYEVSSKLEKLHLEFDNEFDYNIFYFENENLNIEQIEKNIKKSKAKVIFVDYIQQLEGNIRENTKALKRLAVKYKCIIFIFSQLNRSANNRIPDASMLSKSDNILHDSDQVWLLHDSGLKTTNEDDALIINIAKNRKGKIGTLWIAFNKYQGSLFDIKPEYFDDFTENYKIELEEKCPNWAKKIIESIDNIDLSIPKQDKPFMILKSGIIL